MKFQTASAARRAPFALILLGSAALGAPAVTVSRTTGHPTLTVQVSGTGFAASEAVDIYFDTTDMLLDVTNGSGKFGPDNLTVPADALPGSHWITAIGRKNGDAGHSAFKVSTRWVSRGFSERERGRNPYENVIDASNVGNLDLAWAGVTGGAVLSSPAVANVTSSYDPDIFVGSFDHSLYAFDSTGALKWSKATGSSIISSPAIASTTVYVGSEDGKLYAFNAQTGAKAWASPAVTGGPITSSPAVANGIVYVGSQDGKLYAFHASDGSPAWTSAAAGSAIDHSSPAVAKGVVYIGSLDDKLYAFDATTGASAWSTSFATGGAIYSSPAVAGGVVYFGSLDGNIYAVNATTGLQQWAASTGGSVYSSAAVANGVVYIGSQDGKLYALNANSGAILWTGTLGGLVGWSGASVANGVVYIGAEGDSKLYAFNANGCGASTCSPLWTAATGSAIESAPAISDGMLYFGSNDKSLYAYALDAGNNAAYKSRRSTQPPSYASLHPDLRLKPVKH